MSTLLIQACWKSPSRVLVGRDQRIMWWLSLLTVPDSYLNQTFLLVSVSRTRGRPGEVLVGEISGSQDSLYGGGV